MKKIILILLLCLTFIGCTKKDLQSEYQSWYEDLQVERKSDEEFPFEVTADVEKLVNDEYMYHVIIDGAKEPIQNIRAMVIHDMKTEDVFPSIGIFDDPVSLSKKEERNSTKGIALVGYFTKTSDHITLKVKVEYVIKEIHYTKYQIISFDKI